MQLFDSHTHLNDAAFLGQEASYIEHAHKLGVQKWPWLVQMPN